MSTFAANFRALIPIEPDEREWALFFIFGLVDRYRAEGDWAAFVEWWDENVDWFSRLFASPEARLGPEGDSLREALGGKNPSTEFVRWRRFAAAHASDSLDEIDRLLGIFLHDV